MQDRQIAILTTGGTIDKTYFDALSEYKVGTPSVYILCRTARVECEFVVEELFKKDSLEISAEDRAILKKSVVDRPESSVIITHGTDTMTETASYLSDVGGKTIVLVGALQPAVFSQTDASFNLGMAFATAQMAPFGVYITMNGCVFQAGRVRKDRDLGKFIKV